MSTERDLLGGRYGDRGTPWGELVRRHSPVVWVVARSHLLDRADAADVVQSTWTALAAHLPRLASPERLRAWLVTTARRESLRIRHRRTQETPGAARVDAELPPPMLYTAHDQALREAFGRLPDRCRELLALRANAPELTHTQLATALGMRAASVARIRCRCLDRLRRHLAEQDLGGC
ncbi:RNA polymerase sigma factor [Actinophytocola xanthii]|uniref:RNA polymerase sigma-70 region 2 domain-containing protein n=1 Tax=Actinophytocola xanthii TaxID=1912961 RepID=A0A1Q8CMZ1_9PSEU|nr:sigma-70 family RNA polymerase sigma factor [Actinophytocola xanthii]OLF15729.1 hypothetical protein BU204_20175 [Actinophytocola xanthii]